MKKKLLIVLLIIFLSVAGVSAWHLISSHIDFLNAEKYYASLADHWVRTSISESKLSSVEDPSTAPVQSACFTSPEVIVEETNVLALNTLNPGQETQNPIPASEQVKTESVAGDWRGTAEYEQSVPQSGLHASERMSSPSPVPCSSGSETGDAFSNDDQTIMQGEGAIYDSFPISGQMVPKAFHTTSELPPVQVDFEGLKALNPEIVGWIYSEGTNINYPVLQAKNNDKYLRTQPDGKHSGNGSIFVDFACLPDFSSDNTIIYGHNLKNGMFSSLSSYQDQTYYDEHPSLWLLTPDQDYRIDLFAGMITQTDSFVYCIGFPGADDRDNFIENSLASSFFESSCIPYPEDHFITLSTCNYTFKDARCVVVGILVPCKSR